MNSKILLLSVLCGLLLFGCIDSNKTTPTVSASGGSAVILSSSNLSNTSTGTSVSGTSGGSNITSTSVADNLGNIVFSQLLTLGIPVQCNIKLTSSSANFEYKLYMKGNEYRVEMPLSGSTYTVAYGCKNSIVTLSKGNDVYMGCDSGQLIQSYNCDWLKFTVNGTADSLSSGDVTSSSFTSADLEQLPATSFTCNAWVYDASKFVASGKVCTVEDILKSANYTNTSINYPELN